MLQKNEFPKKIDFPKDLQNFYLSKPKHINGLNEGMNVVCLLIDEKEMDNQKGGIFSEYKGKRPDQIHYSVGIGLIEDKTNSCSKRRLESQFLDFKKYFELRFGENKICLVKYFIVIACRLPQKLQREFKVNHNNNTLVYAHNRGKQFKIDNIPIYFVKKEG